MTFSLTKTVRFEAAHFLPHHDGICRRLHGHSYSVSLTVAGQNLCESGPTTGMLMDFTELGRLCKAVHDKLDHSCLNDIIDNPTSENLAKWVWDEVVPHLPLLGCVEVEETCTSRCRYSRPVVG